MLSLRRPLLATMLDVVGGASSGAGGCGASVEAAALLAAAMSSSKSGIAERAATMESPVRRMPPAASRSSVPHAMRA